MDLGNLDALFGAIFGVGGVGALTVIVAAIRKMKRGALDDDETIIARQMREITRLNQRAEAAEAKQDETQRELDLETRRRRAADEQAWFYKAHIVTTWGKESVPEWVPGQQGSEQP